jgi:hypothetical protein
MSFLSKMFAQGAGSNPFVPGRLPREMSPDLSHQIGPPPEQQEIRQRRPVYEELAEQLFQQKPQGQQNVVFQDVLPEVERAKLAQRAAEMQSRERLAGEKLSSQEQLKGRELDIRQQRANVYEFKAKNPSLQITVGKDGITRAFNPVDGSMTELGKTGMSEQEAAELNQQHSMERIETRGEQARDIQELRHRQILEQIAARGDESAGLAELRALLAGDRDLIPTQRRADIQLRYNQMINEHPEWKDYVRMNPNTQMPEIRQDSSGVFGIGARKLDKETRSKILAYLYPDPKDRPGSTPNDEEEDDIDKLINEATGGRPPARR